MPLDSATPRPRGARGRPSATSHAAIEQAAFALFAERGFAETTIDDIARAVGVGRRTISRYYPSKNDIPWGQFAGTLEAFAQILAETPQDLPLHLAVHRAILAFNDFPADALPSHRDRMSLILTTPELQAHSVHRYAEWRDVISQFVAARTGAPEHDLFPALVGHLSLALALASYDHWLTHPEVELLEVLEQSLEGLQRFALH